MWEIIKTIAPFLGLLLVLEIINNFRWRSGFMYEKFYPKDTRTYYTKKLNKELKRRGWNTKEEFFDGYKKVDIAILNAKLYIEVDGSQHNWNYKQALRDLQRDYYSLEDGFITIHVPNSLIKKRFSETMEYLEKIIKFRQH